MAQYELVCKKGHQQMYYCYILELLESYWKFILVKLVSLV